MRGAALYGPRDLRFDSPVATEPLDHAFTIARSAGLRECRRPRVAADRYEICRVGRNSARCFNVPTRMPYVRGSCGSVARHGAAAGMRIRAELKRAGNGHAGFNAR
jgi:hypothetical protein